MIWLAVWESASRIIGYDIILVSPIRVLFRLSELIVTEAFLRAVLNSFLRIGGGLLIAVVIGTLSGALSVRYRLFRQLIEPPVLVIRTVPVASFIVLSLILLPSRYLAVLIAFMMAMPVMYAGVSTAIRETDKGLLDMADAFGASTLKKIISVYVPSVRASFISSLSVATGFAWKSGIAAEVIGMPAMSIGANLQQAKVYLDTPSLFAWTVVIVFLSLATEKVLVSSLRGLSMKIK